MLYICKNTFEEFNMILKFPVEFYGGIKNSTFTINYTEDKRYYLKHLHGSIIKLNNSYIFSQAFSNK